MTRNLFQGSHVHSQTAEVLRESKFMKTAIQKVGLVSTESVRKHTKKDWDQWVELLDAEGARNWTYQQIVAFLKKKFKLSLWWQQGVALGYEMAIGRRIQGQNSKGEFSVTVTKSLHISAAAAWKLLTKKPELWLRPLGKVEFKPGKFFEAEGGIFGEIRTLKTGRRIRMTWQDSEESKHSVVQILIVPRPKDKCILVFQHEKLVSMRLRNEMRALWKERAQNISDRNP